MPEHIRWIFDFLVTTGLTAGVVSAAVVWISKEWLSQKIKSQIESEYEHRLKFNKAQLKGEYDQKLETHKAQLKAQGDVEVEKLKSELSIAAAQRQALFSNLHQRRAEVITEIYALLKEAISALADYTKAFEPVGGPSREDRRKIAVDSTTSLPDNLARVSNPPSGGSKEIGRAKHGDEGSLHKLHVRRRYDARPRRRCNKEV